MIAITSENSYVHAALLSMPICTSTLLHVFLLTHTHIPIQSQVIAIHVKIAMFMLLCQACPFAHLLSFIFFWSHTHTYTKSGDSNTCDNSYVHAALPSMPLDVAVSIEEAAKPRVFCCVDVAVSIGETAKLRGFCYVDVAVSIGEAATPRVFCCVDVAVSTGEAATPRVFCCVDVAVSIGEAAKPRACSVITCFSYDPISESCKLELFNSNFHR